jgi:hypothetical protein
MAKKGARRRFVEVNEQLNAHIRRGERDQAQALLRDLKAIVAKAKDPTAAKRMRDVIAFHEERIARMTAQSASLADFSALQGTRKEAPERPLNATCSLCRSAFHREDQSTTVCDVCRPPTRRSVRTVSGGLPGTGKRR